MAYCIKCGVKLENGAEECPLCHTKVNLPCDIHEQKEEPLFPVPMPQKGTGGFNKTSKGIVELILSLLIISEITVALTMWFSGNFSHGFIPLFSIMMAALILIMAFVAKHTYFVQASVHMGLAAVFLLGIDLYDRSATWSLIATGGLCLLWVLAVFPASKTAHAHPIATAVKMGTVYLLYIVLINLVVKGNLTWFLPVALPTSAVLFCGVALFFVLYLTRKRTRIPLADLVFFCLIVLFFTFTALDLFLTHYWYGYWALRWSISLFSAAIILSILLSGVTVSRRLRRFFTSQNRHA